MMRSNPTSSMQKTYDEVFLVCSTAIYFENQNNEAEALRSWKNALDQIYYHNAYRMPANYRPKSSTEKALADSFKELELQCKERVDLLEALKQSRKDGTDPTGANGRPEGTVDSKAPALLPVPGAPDRLTPTTSRGNAGWLGGGTIPPADYSSLGPPPPLPNRPSMVTKWSSSGEQSRPLSQVVSNKSTDMLPLSTTTSAQSQRRSRTPSPTKRGGMLRTLRTHSKDSSRASSSNSRTTLRSRPPAAAKAATQAWARPSDDRRPSSDSVNQLATETAKVTLQAKIPEVENTAKPLPPPAPPAPPAKPEPLRYRHEYTRVIDPHTRRLIPEALNRSAASSSNVPEAKGVRRKKVGNQLPPRSNIDAAPQGLTDSGEDINSNTDNLRKYPRKKRRSVDRLTPDLTPSSDSQEDLESPKDKSSSELWEEKCKDIMKRLPKGVDETAAKQILNEIVIQGDEVHWEDIAGLEAAKSALKETVVYPFLRPDLFMGLREPARGMLLFGPPGTGKTMLARAVATESKSTFFAISASSLTSKFLGESEKLVRALFTLAKALAPSIIFVDEIDSLLSSRAGASEHEATRRIKTEFLIQWSDLAKAAAGRETSEKDKDRGDASRVLVLAATNMPWAIDEAARRRFVRRQYIPLPEDHVRAMQLRTLLSHQKHKLSRNDIEVLVQLTDGFSGSDITALAKDAAMGPLRSLGEKLLSMSMDEIRPISFDDFEASLISIRPSVSKQGLREFEDWARDFGERGG